MTVRVLEHSRGYYDCREVPFGTEYVWCPGRIVLECACGEQATLLGSSGDARCQCGTDLAAFVRSKLRTKPRGRTMEEGDTNHPWRPTYQAWSGANRKYDSWQEELRELE